MTTIKVTSQKEFDELPNAFEKYTQVHIISEKEIIVKECPKEAMLIFMRNSKGRLYGNSRAELRENSSAELFDNSSAELWDNSRAELWTNSRAELRENSSAELWENSSAELWENSSAELWENSSAKLRDSSRAELFDNSSAELWDNSSAKLYGNSSAVLLNNSIALLYGYSKAYLWCNSVGFVRSNGCSIEHLADKATAKFLDGYSESIIKKKDPDAQVVTMHEPISFETWLSRGYVVADGIMQKLLSQTVVNGIDVFEVESFLYRKTSYVAKRGDVFSHGETIEKAIEDLRYKISDRDKSSFEYLKENPIISIEEAIQAYRVITGACEFGVKEFVSGLKLPNTITPVEIINMTKGQYGHEEFKEFVTKEG